jgi:putative DNA primase/helicase
MTAATISISAIPAEMRSLQQWVCWRREKDPDGRPTKIPYRADGLGRASTSAPATWSTFDAVSKAAHKFDGIGFVTKKECGIVLLDLDHW